MERGVSSIDALQRKKGLYHITELHEDRQGNLIERDGGLAERVRRNRGWQAMSFIWTGGQRRKA